MRTIIPRAGARVKVSAPRQGTLGGGWMPRNVDSDKKSPLHGPLGNLEDQKLRRVTGRNFTADKKERVLNHLALGYSIAGSAKKVGVSPATISAHRKKDEHFNTLCELAIEQGTEYLEDVALERVTEGVPRSVYYQGEKVDETRDFSDTLLIFLLKARKPEKYRDRMDLTTGGKDWGSAFQAAAQAAAQDLLESPEPIDGEFTDVTEADDESNS